MAAKGNIALIGFMGSGKTAAGRLLAAELGLTFVDTDEEIEKTQKKTIPVIFSQNGEKFFRDIESRVLKKLAGQSGLVIATGGGAVLRDDNVAALAESAHVICLRASPAVILRRTGANNDRPLLDGENRLEKIISLLKAREAYYGRAEYTVDTDGKSLPDIVGEIMNFLRKADFRTKRGGVL